MFGSDDYIIRLWDLVISNLQQILEGYSNLVWSVVFLSDGWFLAFGFYDNIV